LKGKYTLCENPKMIKNTRIALAQYPITACATWADWLTHVARWVAEAASAGAQLLVFPEYASMELVSLMPAADRADLSRQIGGMEALRADFVAAFGAWAQQHGVCIVAPSLPVAAGGRCVNRAYVCGPSGVVGYQDKWMMTRFEAEEWAVQSPEWPELTVFNTDWGSFGVQTCYDVEFPIGAALLARAGADLVLAPSCTETARGATRVHVGARARALENQCYVGVSQVVGVAPWSLAVDVNYGYAAVYSPPDVGFSDSGVVAEGMPQASGWVYADLDFSLLTTVRHSGAVLNARDHLQVQYQLAAQKVSVRRLGLS
jgi:predicted amidohydrolase